jgi:hypothetical protein
MSDPAPSLRERITIALESLAARPWLLALLALALNALAQPYLGLYHDARLYALLASNRASGGALGHDLFLAYGSQDSYSLFSLLTAPLVAGLGVPTTFFLLYLLSRVLFFYGLARFLLRLFGPTPLAALSVLILAVDPLRIGGFGVFQVNEAFLSPRLPAHGFTLLGLAWLLDRRWFAAAVCFVLGCALHPLIAFVGFPLLVGWAILLGLPRRGWVLLLVLALVGGLLLAIPPLNYRLFGVMEADWLDQVRVANSYHFPDLWPAPDWQQIALVLALVLVLAWLDRSAMRERANFLALSVLVGTVGLLATTVSSELGYRLLFQAQPYRWLWIAHVLAVPCLVQLVARAWATTNEPGRILTALLALLLLSPAGHWQDQLLPVALVPIFVLWFRGLELLPRRPDWASVSLAAALTVGMVAWGVYRVTGFLNVLPILATAHDAIGVLAFLVHELGIPVFLVLILGLLALLAGSLRDHPARVAGLALAVFLLLHVGLYTVSQTPWYREHYSLQGANTRFVAEALADRHGGEKWPMIYWPNARIERVWVEVRASAFFDYLQLSGLIFTRDTAREGFRRGAVVGLFEMERLHRLDPNLANGWDEGPRKLYQVPVDDSRPTAADVRRLAQEPGLDYIVLDFPVDLPALATNGSVTIYPCAPLRVAPTGEGSR